MVLCPQPLKTSVWRISFSKTLDFIAKMWEKCFG